MAKIHQHGSIDWGNQAIIITLYYECQKVIIIIIK